MASHWDVLVRSLLDDKACVPVPDLTFLHHVAIRPATWRFCNLKGAARATSNSHRNCGSMRATTWFPSVACGIAFLMLSTMPCSPAFFYRELLRAMTTSYSANALRLLCRVSRRSTMLLFFFKENDGYISSDNGSVQVALEPEMSRLEGIVRIVSAGQTRRGRICLRRRRRDRWWWLFNALRYLRERTTTSVTSLVAPHTVTNHVNAAKEKLRRIGCLDGKQRMHRGLLKRVQRAVLGMGVMKPISKVYTIKKPTTFSYNSSTTGVSCLE